MKFFKISDAEAIGAAADAVRAGGVVIYPTDTLYGIGVDARSPAAVRKVDALKDREGKPTSIVVSDIAMAEKYCSTEPISKRYMQLFLPGPYTFVLDRKGEGIARNAAGDTIGIRIPKSEFAIALVRKLGFPITTTSANITGKPGACKLDELEEAMREKADVVVDGGECEHKEGSTVVDLRGDSAVVLRRGAGYERFLELQKSIL